MMTYAEFVRRVLTIILILAITAAVWHVRQIILLTFLAMIIAVSLSLPVNRLRRMGMKRNYAIMISVGTFITVVILLFVWIFPPVVQQMGALGDELPAAVDAALAEYDQFLEDNEALQNILPSARDEGVSSSLGLQGADDDEELLNFDRIVDFALPTLRGLGNVALAVVANIFVVLVVSIYLLVDPRDFAHAGAMMLPTQYHTRYVEVLVELQRTLTAWLATISLSITITIGLVYFGLGIVWGVPNALALGVIAGLFTIIPNIGAIVPLVPITIFALADEPENVVFVIITYLIIQQVESNVITPSFVKERMNIPAAATLLFQLIAASLFGFLGVLMAVPLLAVIVTLVREIYVYDMLGMRHLQIEIMESEEGLLELKEEDTTPTEEDAPPLITP